MTLQEIEEKFGGTWKLVRSEKFDEFLQAMGMGVIKRTMAAKVTPIMTISVEDDVIKIATKTPIQTRTIVTKLNEEFVTKVLDRTEKSVLTFEDGKLIIRSVPKDAKQKEAVVERDIIDGELVQIMTVGDVVCKRIFARSQ